MRDITLGETIYFLFTTRDFDTGAPQTLGGTPALSVYEENNLTQITSGVSISADYDSVTGLNQGTIVATSGNGYEAGKHYSVVITTGTVDSVSVVGEVVYEFTVEASAAFARLGAPAGASVSADIATIDGNVDSILVDTAEIGAAGAGLTNIPWNASWDAEVQSEVNDGLVAYNAVATTDLPTNFSDLSITVTTGQVTVGTNNDKTGYSISGSKTTLDALNDVSAADVWDEVLTGATHNIANSAGRRLRALQEFQGYEGGAVWIDTNNGTAGTTSYENGTVENPVDTIADANTIATALSFFRYRIGAGSSITLAATESNKEFVGNAWALGLGAQTITGSFIYGADAVSGTADVANANKTEFEKCGINAVTIDAFVDFLGCGFDSTLTMASTAGVTADEVNIILGYSNVPGSGAPTFDFSGVTKTTNVNVRKWSGGATWTFTSDCVASVEVQEGGTHTITTGGGDIEFRGKPKALVLTTSGSGTTNIVIWSGAPITINGTGGTVNVYGMHGGITDNSSGTTVTDSGADITDIPSILADTNELQGDWADGGRLDLLVDAIKAVTDNLPDSGALTTIASNITAILTDTGTTLDTKINTIDTLIDAIKAKTDSLTFTSGTDLDCNIQKINDVTITGNGTSGNEFGV